MKTRAAVAWEGGKPLSIKTIELDGPKAGEGLCCTDRSFGWDRGWCRGVG